MTHCFFVDDLSRFLFDLEEKGYRREASDTSTHHSKILSKALIKLYAYPSSLPDGTAIPVRASYQLINKGKGLHKLVRELHGLNRAYRQALPGWRTKRNLSTGIRRHRWQKLQEFLRAHEELIRCFQVELAEGLYAYSLQTASTPNEQTVCLQFIKELADAAMPRGIVRGRRGADEPVLQRNGWIKRFTREHKKRGWNAREIVQNIQKQLRDGTWNERSRLQYNIADSTICRLAGVKVSASLLN